MRIAFVCPSCNKPHSVDAALAGRKGRCKDCGTVMTIPTASPSSPPAAKKARSGPAPTSVTPTSGDVDDPYGLVDEPVAPRSASVRLGPIARPAGDPDASDAPSSDAPARKKRKKSQDEGPWGESLRAGAIGLMGLVLVLNRGIKYARRAHQGATIGSQIQVGMLILCLLAALLSIISVAGAAISYVRGNRGAFKGESVGGQVAWGLSVIASLVVAYVYVRSLTGPTRAELAALDASLSAAEQAEDSTYESMMADVLSYHERKAAALESLPGPFSMGGKEAWEDLGIIEGDALRIHLQARLVARPTRDQVRRLFDAFEGRYREAIARTARTAADAIARLELRPGTEYGDILHEIADQAAQVDKNYRQVYRPGGPPTGWYVAVLGEEAGASPLAGPNVKVLIPSGDDAGEADPEPPPDQAPPAAESP